MFKFYKKGFSLAELMVVLLLVSLLITALIPIVTKKHLSLPNRSEHGSYLCYIKEGKYHEMTTLNKYNGQDREVEQCVFNPPAKALYFQISAIGGGGGGGDSGYKGGNTHSTWSGVQEFSPFGLKEEDVRAMHIIYGTKGYFPPVTNNSQGNMDLSATISAYAKSYGSFQGGDIGYIDCHLDVIGDPVYYNTTSPSFKIADCPTLCKECIPGTEYSCPWSGNYKKAPGGTQKHCIEVDDDCREETIVHEAQTVRVCTEYKKKQICEYYCYQGNRKWHVSSSSFGVEACGGYDMGKDCTDVYLTGDSNCKTWEEKYYPAWEETQTVCHSKKTVCTDTPTSEPVDESYNLSFTCCECKDGETISNEECEKKKKELEDELNNGNIWGDSGTCYPKESIIAQYAENTYDYTGGDAGSGVMCKKELKDSTGKNIVYNLRLGTSTKARHNGAPGTINSPKKENKYPTGAYHGEDGYSLCADDTVGDCNTGSDKSNSAYWANVEYSEMPIYVMGDDGEISATYAAKAYNAPTNGKGAKAILADIFQAPGLSSITYSNYDSSIKLHDNSLGEIDLCDGATYSDLTYVCDYSRQFYDDVEVGEDGEDGVCWESNAITDDEEFCGIPSDEEVGYCMMHHQSSTYSSTDNAYDIGFDSDGNLVKILKYEPGYGSDHAPKYRYRYLRNSNYLQYGNAGSPGELKTMVVRSLKNMDTTIKIGRGGAGGVKGSGADGFPGSATSFGSIVIAKGGNGGAGGIVGQTELLPGYDADLYAKEKACINNVVDGEPSPLKASECSTLACYGQSDCEYQFFKSTGKMQGSISFISSIAEQIHKWYKSQTKDAYDNIFDEQGKGGEGGGVNHKCWAGQFIVWFEGEILKDTSIFRGTPGTSRYKLPGQLTATETVPSGAAGYLPEEGKCYNPSAGAGAKDYDIIEAGIGSDGALLIRW